MEDIDEKAYILTNLHHFFTTCIWDALTENANRMKPSLNSTQRCSNHVFLLEPPQAHTVARSYDMEGHARKCVERYCELANKKWSNFTKFHVFAWMIINSSRKNSDQLENCQKFAYKLSRNACIWHELDDLTFVDLSTNLRDQSQNGLKHVINV